MKHVYASDATQPKRKREFSPGARAVVFILITFALTWSVEFGVIWPMATNSTGPLAGYGMNGMSVEVYALISCMMLMPTIGMLLTRLFTREGMRNAWVKPVAFRRTWKWWIVAWLGTIALVAAGAIVYFLMFPYDFDPAMNAMVASTMQTVREQGLSIPEDQVRAALYGQLALLFFVPFVNVVAAFGEEWGWRGYLMPKLMQRFSVVPALLVMGVVWGLWHLPLTMLGHNYGTGYAGYPFLGIVAMCWMCCCIGVFFSYLTLKTGTCIPAAIAHGFFNGCASVGVLFSATDGDALVGPAATGIVGCLGFAICSFTLLVIMHRRQRAELPLSVRAPEMEASVKTSDGTPEELL